MASTRFVWDAGNPEARRDLTRRVTHAIDTNLEGESFDLLWSEFQFQRIADAAAAHARFHMLALVGNMTLSPPQLCLVCGAATTHAEVRLNTETGREHRIPYCPGHTGVEVQGALLLAVAPEAVVEAALTIGAPLWDMAGVPRCALCGVRHGTHPNDFRVAGFAPLGGAEGAVVTVWYCGQHRHSLDHIRLWAMANAPRGMLV